MKKNGFSLVELLVILAIMIMLAAMILAGGLYRSRTKAKEAIVKNELAAIYKAAENYTNDYGNYPANAPSGGIPQDLKTYLSKNKDWTTGPWPASSYEWENYDDTLGIIQITLRNVPSKGNLYWCIKGSCVPDPSGGGGAGECVNCQ